MPDTIQTTTDLPKRCFISHSYKDSAIRQQLIDSLPKGVQPIIFPSITARPSQMISRNLISTILRCDGLIYLEGGYSQSSFWVAFERDFALRARKKVFAFIPQTSRLRLDTSAPLHLPIFLCHSGTDKDYTRVERIIRFMRVGRFFDIWLDQVEIGVNDTWWLVLLENIQKYLHSGGYLLVFWSADAARSGWMKEQLAIALRITPSHQSPKLLFALLDDTPLPSFAQSVEGEAVSIYDKNNTLEMHGIDDLIVRLYWLIYRNTQHKGLD
ncbi:MAG TPA: toll/interleukin-1 receptor domain-containing protein [Ktedonobacteraceae bacterium]